MIINMYPKIVISKDSPGLYVFYENGAMGKTYVANLLKKYYSCGGDVCVITYDSYSKSPMTYGDVESASLIFIDRLDLYISKDIIDLIKSKSKSSIILVDLKDISLLGNVKSCSANIEIREDHIEVVLFDESSL